MPVNQLVLLELVGGGITPPGPPLQKSLTQRVASVSFALRTFLSMSKQDDPMDIYSDSDISIDLEATSKSKGKNKAKINDKRKADKRKGKAKDTVSEPQILYKD